MIHSIHVRNFAIVDDLEVNFRSGMTVLTGETGAGKSILLDALNLALGGRADSNTIKHGADKAEIQVSFDISKHKGALRWLADNELEDEDGQCLIRRVAAKDGPSKGFINGRAMPMGSLRELGELLVDIHGQHAHQSLLKKELQREALDEYAGLLPQTEQVASAHQALKALQQKRDQLLSNAEERRSRMELLSYQVGELQAMELLEGEYPLLEEQYNRLAHAQQIQESCQQTLYELSDNDNGSINQQLGRMLQALQELQQFDPKLQNICQILNDALAQTEDAARELRYYGDGLELDPQQLEQLNNRIAEMLNLARKHQVKPDELYELLSRLEEELTQLQQAADESASLDDDINSLREDYLKLAHVLSDKRKRAAARLSKAVTANMQQLGMEQGKFSIAITDSGTESRHGVDNIEFMVAANPGQPAGPLSKIASGGELSRISLAIQVITAGSGHIPSLIFDEVDVGIGGGTAEIVGKLLKGLSEQRQVLCVTHQAQVASQGDHHFRVMKFKDKKSTQTDVVELSPQQRVDEIARMLGGVEITQHTLTHAREMLGNMENSPAKAGAGKTTTRKSAKSSKS